MNKIYLDIVSTAEYKILKPITLLMNILRITLKIRGRFWSNSLCHNSLNRSVIWAALCCFRFLYTSCVSIGFSRPNFNRSFNHLQTKQKYTPNAKEREKIKRLEFFLCNHIYEDFQEIMSLCMCVLVRASVCVCVCLKKIQECTLDELNSCSKCDD